MEIVIKNRWSDSEIASGEADSLKEFVRQQVASDANLRGADLRGANLSDADLSDAKYSSRTFFPAPPIVLLASWGSVSSGLCALLMRYDAANHPTPEKFNEWAKGGDCPYSGVRWQRAANFAENRASWNPELLNTPALSALELAELLLKEKCVLVESEAQ